MDDNIYLIKGEELECAICLESWLKKDARILPCDHTFCYDCLERLVTEQSITCPQCRKRFNIPRNDITRIRKNQIHRILIDESEGIAKVLCFSILRFSINRN